MAHNQDKRKTFGQQQGRPSLAVALGESAKKPSKPGKGLKQLLQLGALDDEDEFPAQSDDLGEIQMPKNASISILNKRASSRLSRAASTLLGKSNFPTMAKRQSLASFQAQKTFKYTEDDPELFRHGMSLLPGRENQAPAHAFGEQPRLTRGASKMSNMSGLKSIGNLQTQIQSRVNQFQQFQNKQPLKNIFFPTIQNIQKPTLSELLDQPFQGYNQVNQFNQNEGFNRKKSFLPISDDQIAQNAKQYQVPSFAREVSTVAPYSMMQPFVNKRGQKVQSKFNTQQNQMEAQGPPETPKPPPMTKRQEAARKAAQQKDLKRRGRKRERDDVYFDQGYKKIANIQAKLKTAKQDGMKVEDRQRLRNQISAQKSRLKKKEENMFLNKKVREKDQLFISLVGSVVRHIDPSQLQSMINDVSRLWNIDSSAGSFNNTSFSNGQPQLAKRSSTKMKQANSSKNGSEDLKELLIKNFITTKDELDQFQQNDEKIYEDDD